MKPFQFQDHVAVYVCLINAITMPVASFCINFLDLSQDNNDGCVQLCLFRMSVNYICLSLMQIQAAFRTDEIRRTPPTPQDEMRAGMSYFHETIWKGVPKFLRRLDTALKNIGIQERVPYNAPVIQFSSWMGGDRDGKCVSLPSSMVYCYPIYSKFIPFS